MARNPTWYRTSWIIAPAVVGLALSWVAILWIVYSAASGIDRHDLVRDTRLAQSALRLAQDKLATEASDFSFWNDAIRNLVVKTDPKWADDNIGSYMHTAFGVSGSYVVAGDGRTLIAFEDGKPADADALSRFPDGLKALIERSDQASTDSAVPIAGLLSSRGVVYAVAASVFQQEHPTDGLDLPKPRPALVLARALDGPVLAEYADTLQLRDLSIAPVPTERAFIALKAPSGVPLGYMTWHFQASGHEFLTLLALPIGFSVLLTVAFLVLLVRRASAVAMAQKELVAANEAKSNFLANMSHELRTPLNAIIGFSDVIRTEPYGPIGHPKYTEYLDDIQRSGWHLLELINDVLDLSAIEDGSLVLREEAVATATLIAEAVRLVQARAERGGVVVGMSVPPGTPAVYVDRRRMKQVLLNLLSNAVKFTPPGGTVTVAAATIPDGGLAISVSDTGIGMDAAEVQTALERFGQVDSFISRASEGTGLGLPLTKGLLEQMGGTLTIESAKGAGTRATATLPRVRILPSYAGDAVAAG